MGIAQHNPIAGADHAQMLATLEATSDTLAAQAVALRDRGPGCPDLDRIRRALGHVDMAIMALRGWTLTPAPSPRGHDDRLPPGRPHP